MTGSSTSRRSSEGHDLETEIHVNDNRRRGKNNSELVRLERIPKVARSWGVPYTVAGRTCSSSTSSDLERQMWNILLALSSEFFLIKDFHNS